jgi:Holliday junction resolvase RusA-like endonuclease
VDALLAFTVEGDPVPQGSKRVVPTARGARAVESNRSTLHPWRQAVTAAAMAAVGELATSGAGYEPRELPLVVEGPVALGLTFTMRRPLAHYGTGRNARQVRPSAPWYVSTRPDLDKLVRGVLDALSGVGYRDDGQVAALRVAKVYGPRGQLHVELVRLPHGQA